MSSHQSPACLLCCPFPITSTPLARGGVWLSSACCRALPCTPRKCTSAHQVNAHLATATSSCPFLQAGEAAHVRVQLCLLRKARCVARTTQSRDGLTSEVPRNVLRPEKPRKTHRGLAAGCCESGGFPAWTNPCSQLPRQSAPGSLLSCTHTLLLFAGHLPGQQCQL